MKKNKAKVQNSLDEFLTVRELANWIKLSESHVYFMVNKNKIPFAKLGGKLLFESNAIRRWITANSKPVVKKNNKKKIVLRKKKDKVNLSTPKEFIESKIEPTEISVINELTPLTE